MRVCIAVPSISDFYFSIDRMSALGARTVCRIVENAGHQTLLVDFPRLAKRATQIQRPKALSHLERFLIDETGPVSFFTSYKRLGPDHPECARRIAEYEPDLLLISCFAYAYAEDALSLARAVYKLTPRLTIVAGGAGATAFPDKFLRSAAIAYVLSGEAETNLSDFLSEYGKRDPDFYAVPGLYFKKSGEAISKTQRRETTEDELNWAHVTSKELSGGYRLSTSLSRGCPKRCSFCSNFICHGRSFRKVPIERVAWGIESAAGSIIQSGVGAKWRLNFEDDNIFADPEYALTVIDFARDKLRRPAIVAENGIDSSYLDEPLLDRLIDAGFRQLNLSLGSIDPGVLSGVRRDETAKKIETLTSRAAARGVGSVTYFICGLPGDTRQTVADNLLYLASLETRIGISLFYPTPGIEGFQDKTVFLEASPALCCSSSAYPWTDTLSTKSLITAFRLARLINLLKDSRNAELHKNLVDATFAKQKLYTWQKIGSGTELTAVPNTDRDLVEAVISRLEYVSTLQ